MHSTVKFPYELDGVSRDEMELQQMATNRCVDTSKNTSLPPYPFTTDGCTLWPNGSWEQCCVIHDMAYWCGGPDKLRRKADRDLRMCVDQKSHVNATLMYLGIRVFGTRWMPAPWRWGYGHPWPDRAPPAADESAQAQSRH
jgi:hypothetical protein